MKYLRLLQALLWLTAGGIVLYWISFFTGGEVRAGSAGCYVAFERNFPLPDAFVALCCAQCARHLRRGAAALLWGLLAAGGLLFLGLIDVSYNLWNGMYAYFSPPMAAEVVINIWCIGLGLGLAAALWRARARLPA